MFFVLVLLTYFYSSLSIIYLHLSRLSVCSLFSLHMSSANITVHRNSCLTSSLSLSITSGGTELILTTVMLYSNMSSSTLAPVWSPLCSKHTTLTVSCLPFSFKSLLETQGFNSYYNFYYILLVLFVACSGFSYIKQLSVFLPSKCAGSPHWWPVGLDRPPSCLGST